MKFGVFDHLDRGDLPLGEMYEQRLGYVGMYDRLGYYGYHLAEHHGTPLGMAPSRTRLHCMQGVARNNIRQYRSV